VFSILVFSSGRKATWDVIWELFFLVVSPAISGRSYAQLKPDMIFSPDPFSTHAPSSSLPSFSLLTAVLHGLVGVHVPGAWPARTREFTSLVGLWGTRPIFQFLVAGISMSMAIVYDGEIFGASACHPRAISGGFRTPCLPALCWVFCLFICCFFFFSQSTCVMLKCYRLFVGVRARSALYYLLVVFKCKKWLIVVHVMFMYCLCC
jgi:hypothetical protein